MRSFEVVSLDLFQTLVNIDTRRSHIWQPILLNTYTDQLADEYAGLLLEGFFKHKEQFSKHEAFTLTAKVYEHSFADVFSAKEISYDCVKANRHLFRQHALSEFYEDTEAFLSRITKKYEVCIVSDADDAMVPPFYKDYGIRLLTSEQYSSYKNDEQNVMFKQLINYYQVAPGRIIHIGDSSSDVLGAKREGITACWLNRNKITWSHEVRPDLIVESLEELDGIL
ncbi:putative hydrolase of the HAD superfamily [Fontibacillus phaseoli]|uniref:Putative hydrolase of the HAD superfamily n=1 Tax=Fontibacillus phaseoli TaxID=1416533 RepID=A0A369BJ60_9BACL|nr:HAD family hydrolase [Fontibacillus phaseoli]RCX21431.1 putative hydrolase of the HAD superfamily [Fontibacillus phaseoli]